MRQGIRGLRGKTRSSAVTLAVCAVALVPGALAASPAMRINCVILAAAGGLAMWWVAPSAGRPCVTSSTTRSTARRGCSSRHFVTVRKGCHGRTPRTWLSLTPKGRRARAAHLDSLRSLADEAMTAVRAEANPRHAPTM